MFTRFFSRGAVVLLASIAAVLAGFFVAAPDARAEIKSKALNEVHRSIVARYQGVSHLTAEELAAMKKAGGQKLLILDVREKDEHAVSRLPGAVRVSPGISAGQFMRSFGKDIPGKTIILYCSVGERSSRLAKLINQAGRSAGAKAIYNLAGGVFNWHNQSRPLSDASGPTEFVHPYSWRWSRFVERRGLTRYRPVN